MSDTHPTSDTSPSGNTSPTSGAKTPLAPTKAPTIAQIVQQAAMNLDGIGLNEKLISQAVAKCEEQMDRIAASALHSVLSTHISQLMPPKPVRRSRKTASNDEPVS